MANRKIEVDIIANDKASSVFRSIRSNASSMATNLSKALGGSVNAVANLDRVLRNYNSSMWRFNGVAISTVKTVGNSIYDFTKDAINNFSNLERQHAKTMGVIATGYDKTAESQRKFIEDSQKLKQQAIQLGTYGPSGKGSLYNISDVSYAQTALAKAGMSASDMLNSDAVEAVLKFAGGNDLDVDTATTFAVNLSTMFDKPVSEWGKMLDMVTKAADISVIDVQDIMESMKYAGGISVGLNKDLGEVLGIISVLGQSGIRGSMAGTGIQSLFTRILSTGGVTTAGAAPTDYAQSMYDTFMKDVTTPDGTLKDTTQISEMLNTAMGSLNDREQAWFAKKIFGMFQMKAGYALADSAEGDYNMLADFINQITNQSEGANDIKYNLMLGSQYGKITALQNVWEGVKTDFGDKLSPIVSAVSDELFAFLSNNGNYDIDWTRLRDAISESGDLIGERYGDSIQEFVENIANFGIDTALVGDALIPQFGGFINGIVKLLNGDISGAMDEFSRGIGDTNENIEGLPENLRETAKAASRLITIFTTLGGINLGAQILQVITTAFSTFVGKPISAIRSLINANKADVNSASTNVNSSGVTYVNIAQASTVNITAAVVNVYGSNSNNPNTNPTNPNMPTTPTLPGGSPLLLPGGGSTLQLPKGTSPLLLPGAGAAAAGIGAAADAGKYTNLYKFGSKYATAGQIAGTVGKFAGLAGIIGGVLTLTGDTSPSVSGKNTKEQYAEYKSKFDNQLNDVNFLNETYKSIVNELGTTGKLSEDFLKKIMTFELGDGSKYTGQQLQLEQLINKLFPNSPTKYKSPWTYGGSFADKSITKYINESITSGGISKEISSQIKPVMMTTQSAIDASKNVTAMSKDVVGNTQSVINSVNNAMNRINNPIINVNVSTHVDKNGNAKSDVDVGRLSSSLRRRSSQYGTTSLKY